MTKSISIKSALVLTAAAFALAACGGSDNNYVAPPVGVVPPAPPAPLPPPPDPEPETATAPEQAGAGFSAAFNLGPFDEPVDPMAGDLNALDKTAEPIIIPDE